MMGKRIARNSGYGKIRLSAGGIGMANEQKVTPQSVRHAPDGAVAVFGNQKRAVMRHGDADGPPPHLGIVDHKSGHEVLIFAGRYAVLEADMDDLVAGAFGPVPRAMLGHKRVAAIVAGKHV